MCLTCHIVPKSVLQRLAKDRSLSAEQRKNFEYTIKLDVEFRQLRKQAAKLTRIASLIAAPVAAAAVPTKPNITVFDSKRCRASSFPTRLPRQMRPLGTY
jgi:hypothetical protein